MSDISGINFIFHSIRQGGGMERYVMDVIAELCRRGIPVKVIARVVNWPDPPNGLDFVVFPNRTPFSRLNNILFERMALRSCRTGWKTIGISRVFGDVDLAIVGGTHIGHLNDKGKSSVGIYDRLTIANETRFYAGASTIVSHSGRVGKEVQKYYGIDEAKIKVLYPPVDTHKFSLDARANREEVRQKLGIRPNQFMLLFPSNNHDLKGADIILDAIGRMDEDVVLVAAGKAPLKSDKVINAGFCDEMPPLYAAADATILASKYEAFGMVGPESILCGTPVLFADTVGATEILSEPGCHVFKRDAAALRTCLERVVRQAKHLERDPASLASQSIHYPYSLEDHVLDLLALLE
ncbi:glycosyltransferase family 4 protein [Chromobacterium subtsugae]|uniref:glycosyltransferase family 4 protein n=1 Tax=Chromobacterium subtsugae TaxID=251747 RepID=UPI000640F03B|nr:glycosyltransferase family 4 protein [Chromobacterium subtsugae]